MKKFTNPARGISALILAIIISAAMTLVIQIWAAQNDDLKGLNMLGWMLEPAVFVIVYLTLTQKWKTAGLSFKIKALKY